jgi:hypothetical protein
LFSTSAAEKLEGIEAGAQKNLINSVDTADFTVDAVGNLTLNNKIAFTSLSADFVVNEDKELTLAKNYVETSLYVAEVGDLSKLVRASGKENSTLVDEINDINARLTWGELTE